MTPAYLDARTVDRRPLSVSLFSALAARNGHSNGGKGRSDPPAVLERGEQAFVSVLRATSPMSARPPRGSRPSKKRRTCPARSPPLAPFSTSIRSRKPRRTARRLAASKSPQSSESVPPTGRRVRQAEGGERAPAPPSTRRCRASCPCRREQGRGVCALDVAAQLPLEPFARRCASSSSRPAETTSISLGTSLSASVNRRRCRRRAPRRGRGRERDTPSSPCLAVVTDTAGCFRRGLWMTFSVCPQPAHLAIPMSRRLAVRRPGLWPVSSRCLHGVEQIRGRRSRGERLPSGIRRAGSRPGKPRSASTWRTSPGRPAPGAGRASAPLRRRSEGQTPGEPSQRRGGRFSSGSALASLVADGSAARKTLRSTASPPRPLPIRPVGASTGRARWRP